jgi:hypothetical protein
MRDWNVVVTIREDGLQAARSVPRAYGPVELTTYLNVSVMRSGITSDPIRPCTRASAT